MDPNLCTQVGKCAGSAAGRSAAMYGMMGTLPNRGDLRELALDVLDGLTRPTSR